MLSMRDENLTGMPEAWMSDMGTARGRVQTQCTSLLDDASEAVDGGVWKLLDPGVVLSVRASILCCTAVLSTSSLEHVGTAPGLLVVKKNQMGSLTESAGLT